jgi:hypothetical protein
MLAGRIIRTCLLLTLTCTWLMWAITYLAQLHPIVGELARLSSLSGASLTPCAAPKQSGRRVEG